MCEIKVGRHTRREAGAVTWQQHGTADSTNTPAECWLESHFLCLRSSSLQTVAQVPGNQASHVGAKWSCLTRSRQVGCLGLRTSEWKIPSLCLCLFLYHYAVQIN